MEEGREIRENLPCQIVEEEMSFATSPAQGYMEQININHFEAEKLQYIEELALALIKRNSPKNVYIPLSDFELFINCVQLLNGERVSNTGGNLMPSSQYRSSKKRIHSTVCEEQTDSEPFQKKQKMDTTMAPWAFNTVHPQVPRKVPIKVLYQQSLIAPQVTKPLSMFTNLF